MEGPNEQEGSALNLGAGAHPLRPLAASSLARCPEWRCRLLALSPTRSPSSQQMHLSDSTSSPLAEGPDLPAHTHWPRYLFLSAASWAVPPPQSPPGLATCQRSPISSWGLGTAYVKEHPDSFPGFHCAHSPGSSPTRHQGRGLRRTGEMQSLWPSCTREKLRPSFEDGGCQWGASPTCCLSGLEACFAHPPLGSSPCVVSISVCLFSPRWEHYISSHFLYKKLQQ